MANLRTVWRLLCGRGSRLGNGDGVNALLRFHVP